VDTNSADLVYADVTRILDTVEANMSSGDLADFRKVTENLRPIKATILQSGVDGDVLTMRWFVLVP
jgi:hypothetical protein